MRKTKHVLLIILLLIFSAVMGRCTSPQKTHSTPVAKGVPDTTKKMYLRSGRIIECDTVWEGMRSEICCRKSGNIITYSAGDVDLIRTFGQSSGGEIAKRYEERVKHRKLMSRSKTVTPEQEKWMKKQTLERERKTATELKAAGITEELIELEKKWLEDKLKSYKEKHRTASGPPPPGRMGFNEREWYERKIESVEKKIEELERDPKFYFYEKSQQRDVRGNVTFFAPTGDGGFINTKTGEVLAPTGDGGAVSTKDGTYYAPAGGGLLVNTKTGEVIN